MRLGGLAAWREIGLFRGGVTENELAKQIVDHKKQLLTHLRLACKRLGLLINFNVALIKDGITRIANGMPD